MASASVSVDKQLISSIGKGVLVFAAIGPDDTRKDAEWMASKVLRMKMWPDEAGSRVRPFLDPNDRSTNGKLQHWKQSVQEIQGEVLCGKFMLDT